MAVTTASSMPSTRSTRKARRYAPIRLLNAPQGHGRNVCTFRNHLGGQTHQFALDAQLLAYRPRARRTFVGIYAIIFIPSYRKNYF